MKNLLNVCRLLNQQELAQLASSLGSLNAELLLSQDGVYNQAQLKLASFYILTDDLNARGLTKTAEANAISYPEFVELTLSHKATIKW